MPMDDFISAYQKLMGTGQSPNNPYLSGRQQLQTNEFSRMLPNHPRVAGVLQDAALMASMIPQSNSIGGGISGVASAMMNLPMARLQHQLGPQLASQQWEDQHAELQAKQMGAFGSLLQGNYWYQRPQLEREQYASQEKIEQMKLDKSMPLDASEHIDEVGTMWKYDPNKGHMVQVSAPGQFLDEMRRTTGTDADRFLAGENAKLVASGKKPMDVDQGLAWLGENYWGPIAGYKARANQNVTEPDRKVDDFINQQEGKVYAGIDPLDDSKDAFLYWKTMEGVKGRGRTATDANFKKYQDGIRAQRAAADEDFGRYRFSDAPKKGISFGAYRNGGVHSPGVPTWNPSTGRYEQ